MRKSMYAILDEKAQVIGPIFLATSDSEAERTVALGVKGNELMIRYPADFALLRLGDIVCCTGRIEAPEVPSIVCKLDEILPLGD